MTTERILNEQVIEAQQRPLILPKRYVTLFKSGDTTPSVMNVEYAKGAGVAVSITNFDMGQEAQTLSLLGDGFMTIVDGADIQTNTGANKLLESGEVYRFTRIDGVWYEDSLDGSAPASDVYTKADSDARFVAKAGDTMTGALLFSPDNTVDIGSDLFKPRAVYALRSITGNSAIVPSTLVSNSVHINDRHEDWSVKNNARGLLIQQVIIPTAIPLATSPNAAGLVVDLSTNSGSLEFGGSLTGASILVTHGSTKPINAINAMFFQARISGGGGAVGSMIGCQGSTVISAGGKLTNSATGVNASVSFSTTNPAVDLLGLAAQVTASGAGTVTRAATIFVRSPGSTIAAIGTIYGLLIDQHNKVGTPSYNLYSGGTLSKNYFEGVVGIGNTAPTEKLHVNGNVELDTIGNGLITKSPDGTRWKLSVDNAGVGSFALA